MKKEEDKEQAVIDLIRRSSEAGRLVSESDVIQRLGASEEDATEHGTAIKGLLEKCEDLQEVILPDGSRSYYSSKFMTAAYAHILLEKQGDRRRLIAGIVRENSALYPRPVPIELFTGAPFDFSRDQLLKDLEEMKGEADYADILPVTTSTSRLYVYSARHLDPDHASMLAEWYDVGQSSNP